MNKKITIAFAGASWYDLTHGKNFMDVIKYINDNKYILENEQAVIPSFVSQFWYKK